MAAEDDLLSHVRKRWSALKNARADWFTVWREISQYIAPDMGRFSDDPDKGERRDKSILDNSATRAMRTLAAGLHSGMSSPSQPWLELRAGDAALRDSAPVKAWLAKVRDLLLEVFARSNTYRALHSMYEELGTFGTACAVVAQDFEKVIHLHVLTAGSYALATDAKGNVNTLYRQYSMTVDQLVGEFGLEACSDHVKTQYQSKNLDHQVSVIHAIQPRPQGDGPGMPGALGAGWMEVYFEEATHSRRPLRVSGYQRFTVIAPRWIVSGENVYGTSPGRDSLGDVKQLQHAQLRKSQAIDYQTKPPIQGPAHLKGNNAALLPGGYSAVDAAGPQGGMKTVFEVRLDLQQLVADIADTRNRISRAFYEDVFRMITDLDRSGVTARQIAEQHSEKMMLMGPVLERVQNECLTPLVEITFERLAQTGALPPPPPELQEADAPISVEFVSILAQAQKQAGASAVDRWLGTVGALAPLMPEALDMVDADAVVSEYAQVLGINPDLLRDEDEVAEVRQARAQQQAQQQQMEQQAQQAGAAADMARAQAAGGGQQMPDNTARQLEIARFLGG